jgi:hypothetical protein
MALSDSVVDVEEARHETRASAVCDELVVTERIARDQSSSTLEEKGTVTRRVAGLWTTRGRPGTGELGHPLLAHTPPPLNPAQATG